MVAFRRFTTVLEGRPPHLDHMLPPIVVPESGASQFDIFEDFLFICSMAQHSIDMRLIQAALCHQMSATENGRGVAVRATLDILKLGIGPITGVGEDIWRAMDVVYRLENDALRFAVVRHVSENYEFYRELWEEDMDDREKREAERGSEEGGILRAAFGDQAWWWESGMMAKVMEREAGNARDAVVERGMEASGRYTFERA